MSNGRFVKFNFNGSERPALVVGENEPETKGEEKTLNLVIFHDRDVDGVDDVTSYRFGVRKGKEGEGETYR